MNIHDEWPPGFFSHIRAIATDRSGNFGLMTGLLAVPLLFVVGAVLNVGLALDDRSKLQESADAAALAGAAIFNGTNADETRAEVVRFVRTNATVSTEEPVVDFTNGEVNVALRSTMPATFMRIVGKTSLDIKVSASATSRRTVSSLKITPMAAKGWWYKLVRILVVRPGSSEEIEVGRVEYQPNKWDGANRYGNMVVTPTATFDLGKYQKLILEMNVKEDACPIGTAINHPKVKNSKGQLVDGPDIYCEPSRASYDLRYNRVMRTDDPATMTNIFIDKVQWTTSQKLPIEEFMSCFTKQEHAWEDGGTTPPRYGDHDFTYLVEATCDSISNARLTH